MKRLIFSFLAISFLLIGAKSLKAEVEYGYVKNLLAVNNVLIYDKESDSSLSVYFLKTDQPVKVTKGERYTFIMSKMFFYSGSWGREDRGIVYSFYDENNNVETYHEDDYLSTSNEDYYVSFTARSDWLMLDEVPFDFINGDFIYDYMLISGEIDLFNNEFTSYAADNKTNEFLYLKDIDVDLSLAEILASVGVYDDYEDVTFEVLKDDYTANKDTLGDYEVILMAANSYNMRSFCKIIVKNLDVTPPEFIGATYYEVELRVGMPSLYDITKEMRAYDNMSDFDRLDFIVVEDNYSNTTWRLGEFTVIFKVIDNSFNEQEVTVIINVVDKTPPLITGPREIYRYSTDPTITEREIKDFFSIEDNVDEGGQLTLTITGNVSNIPGVYPLELRTEDSSNNVTIKNININVLGGKAPIFNSTDNYLISEAKFINMTIEEKRDWIASKLTEATNIKILLDESLYKSRNSKPMYMYYSYELNNQTYYGRVLVEPEKGEKGFVNFIIVSLIILNISFGVFYKRRPKIHL